MSTKLDITDEAPPGLTFREKSLWVTLVSTIAIYAYYFARVLQIGDEEPGHVAGLFIATVILMVISEILIHAAMAIHRRPEKPDERDARIALVSTRNSYYVLMSGVWAC